MALVAPVVDALVVLGDIMLCHAPFTDECALDGQLPVDHAGLLIDSPQESKAWDLVCGSVPLCLSPLPLLEL